MKNFRDNKGGFKGGSSKPSFENKSWGVDRGQSYGSTRDKQMFKATCSECGRACEVPFRPTGDKPVFCSDCFNKKREATDTRGGGRPDFNDRGPKRDFNDRHVPRPDFSAPRDPRAPFKPVNDETKKQLSDISFKLDKLIGIIEKMNISNVEVKKEAPVKTVVKKSESKAVKKKIVAKKKK
jgi:CxxC-x17-CxxC domain-containing protein